MNKSFIKIITFVILITLLSQNIVWAEGSGMLMPESEVDWLGRLLAAIGRDASDAWKQFKDGSPLEQLTPEETARLREFLKVNWDSLPGSVRRLFLNLIPGGVRFDSASTALSHKFRKDLLEALETALREDGNYEDWRIKQIINRGLAWVEEDSIRLESDDVFEIAARVLNKVLRKEGDEQITPEQVKAVLEYHETVHMVLGQNRKMLRKVKDALDSLRETSRDNLFNYFANQYGGYSNEMWLIEELIASYYTEKLLLNTLELRDENGDIITIDQIDRRIAEFIERHTGRLIESINIRILNYGETLMRLNETRREKRGRECERSFSPASPPGGGEGEGVPDEEIRSTRFSRFKWRFIDIGRLELGMTVRIIGLETRGIGKITGFEKRKEQDMVIILFEDDERPTPVLRSFMQGRTLVVSEETRKPESQAAPQPLVSTDIKSRIKEGDTLADLRGMSLSLKDIWQIILIYNEAIEELQGGITWERKMRLWQERNYWRERLWDIFKDKNKGRKKLEWKEFARELDIDPKVLERTCYDYLLEKYMGDLEAIKQVTADNFRKLGVQPNIELRVRNNRLLSKWYLVRAMRKAQNGEELDRQERHAIIYEFIKGNYQSDPTFPKFSYTTKVNVVYEPHSYYVEFFYWDRKGEKYDLRMVENIKHTFNKKANVIVESVFDKENYGWVFKIRALDAGAEGKELCFILNKDKNKMALLDPVQQSVVDAIKPKENIFGKPTTPQTPPDGKLDTKHARMLIREMIRHNKFSDMNLVLFPFQITASVIYIKKEPKGGVLIFGDIEEHGYHAELESRSLKPNTSYQISFYYSEYLGSWVFFAYEIKDGGFIEREPAIVFTGRKRNGKTRLYQLTNREIENIYREKHIEAPRPETVEIPSNIKELIEKGDTLEGIKDKYLTPSQLWQIITAYSEIIEELNGKITWQRKMQLWNERNFWRKRLWDVFKDEYKGKRLLQWERYARQEGIEPDLFQRVIYDYLLEVHRGNLELIKNDLTELLEEKEQDVEQVIEKKNLLPKLYFTRALGKIEEIEKREDLDDNERAEIVHEFLEGNYQADPTFPRFSYTAQTKPKSVPNSCFVPFLYRKRQKGREYRLEMIDSIYETFGRDTMVRVESVFDEHNYGWLYRLTGRGTEDKVLYFRVNDDKTKMDLIDPVQQTVIDVISSKTNVFGKPVIIRTPPSGELDTMHGRRLIREMIRHNKFKDSSLTLFPFCMTTRVGHRVEEVLDDFIGLKPGTEYRIEFFFSKRMGQWICLAYEILEEGKTADTPSVVFSGQEKDGKTRLYQLSEDEVSQCISEIKSLEKDMAVNALRSLFGTDDSKKIKKIIEKAGISSEELCELLNAFSDEDISEYLKKMGGAEPSRKKQKQGLWQRLPLDIHRNFIKRLLSELERVRQIINSGEKDHPIIRELETSPSGRRTIKGLGSIRGDIKFSDLRSDMFSINVGRIPRGLLSAFYYLYDRRRRSERLKISTLGLIAKTLGFIEEKKKEPTLEEIEERISQEFEAGDIQQENTDAAILRICVELGIDRKSKWRKEVARLFFTYRFYEVLKEIRKKIDGQLEGVEDEKEIRRIRKRELRVLRSGRFKHTHRALDARLRDYYKAYESVFERNKDKIEKIMGFPLDYRRYVYGVRDSTEIIAWLKGKTKEVPGGFDIHIGKGGIYTLICSKEIYINLTGMFELRGGDYWMNFEQDKKGRNKYAVIWNSEDSADIEGAEPLQRFQIVEDGVVLAQRWEGKATNKTPTKLLEKDISRLIRRFLLKDGDIPPGFETTVRGGKGEGTFPVILCAFSDFAIKISSYLSSLKGKKVWITFEKDEEGDKYAVVWENKEASEDKTNPYGYLRKYYLVKDGVVLNQKEEEDGKQISTGKSPIIYTWKDHLKVIIEGEEIRPEQIASGEKVEFLVQGLLHKDPNIADNAKKALSEWTNAEGGVKALLGFMAPEDTSEEGIRRNMAILGILEAFEIVWTIVIEHLGQFRTCPYEELRNRAIALREKLIRKGTLTDLQLEEIIRGNPDIRWEALHDRCVIHRMAEGFKRQNIDVSGERLFKLYYKIRFFDYLRKLNERFKGLKRKEKKKRVFESLIHSAVLKEIHEVVSGLRRYWNGYRNIFKECNEEIEDIFGFKVDYERDILPIGRRPSGRQLLIDWISGERDEIPKGTYYKLTKNWSLQLIRTGKIILELSHGLGGLTVGNEYWVSFEVEDGNKIATVWINEEESKKEGGKYIERFYLVKDGVILAQRWKGKRTRLFPEPFTRSRNTQIIDFVIKNGPLPEPHEASVTANGSFPLVLQKRYWICIPGGLARHRGKVWVSYQKAGNNSYAVVWRNKKDWEEQKGLKGYIKRYYLVKDGIPLAQRINRKKTNKKPSQAPPIEDDGGFLFHFAKEDKKDNEWQWKVTAERFDIKEKDLIRAVVIYVCEQCNGDTQKMAEMVGIDNDALTGLFVAGFTDREDIREVLEKPVEDIKIDSNSDRKYKRTWEEYISKRPYLLGLNIEHPVHILGVLFKEIHRCKPQVDRKDLSGTVNILAEMLGMAPATVRFHLFLFRIIPFSERLYFGEEKASRIEDSWRGYLEKDREAQGLDIKGLEARITYLLKKGYTNDGIAEILGIGENDVVMLRSIFGIGKERGTIQVGKENISVAEIEAGIHNEYLLRCIEKPFTGISEEAKEALKLMRNRDRVIDITRALANRRGRWMQPDKKVVKDLLDIIEAIDIPDIKLLELIRDFTFSYPDKDINEQAQRIYGHLNVKMEEERHGIKVEDEVRKIKRQAIFLKKEEIRQRFVSGLTHEVRNGKWTLDELRMRVRMLDLLKQIGAIRDAVRTEIKGEIDTEKIVSTVKEKYPWAEEKRIQHWIRFWVRRRIESGVPSQRAEVPPLRRARVDRELVEEYEGEEEAPTESEEESETVEFRPGDYVTVKGYEGLGKGVIMDIDEDEDIIVIYFQEKEEERTFSLGKVKGSLRKASSTPPTTKLREAGSIILVAYCIAGILGVIALIIGILAYRYWVKRRGKEEIKIPMPIEKEPEPEHRPPERVEVAEVAEPIPEEPAEVPPPARPTGVEIEMGEYLKGRFSPPVVEELVRKGMRLIKQGVLEGKATPIQLAEYLALLEKNRLRGRFHTPVRLIYSRGAQYKLFNRRGEIVGIIKDLIVLKQGAEGWGYEHLKKHLPDFKGIDSEEQLLSWLVKTIREGYKRRYNYKKDRRIEECVECTLCRQETNQSYTVIIGSDDSIITFYPENFNDFNLSERLSISPEQVLLLFKFLTDRIPVTIDRNIPDPASIRDLVIGYERNIGKERRIQRRIYYFPRRGEDPPAIGIWHHRTRRMVLMDLNGRVFDVRNADPSRDKIDITGDIHNANQYYLSNNEGGNRRIIGRGTITTLLVWIAFISLAILVFFFLPDSGSIDSIGEDLGIPFIIGMADISSVVDRGVRYLKEKLAGGKTLEDRIIWTGIMPATSNRWDVRDLFDLYDEERWHTLISVGKNVFQEIGWGYANEEFGDIPLEVLRNAINNMLLKDNGAILSSRLRAALGRDVDLEKEIEWLWIDKYQEGSETGVFRVVVHLSNGEEVKFGIISARNSGLGSKIVQNDRKNLVMVGNLYQDFNREHGDVLPQEIPKVYEEGYGSCRYKGKSQKIYMFLVEWLEDVYEVHPMLDSRRQVVFKGLSRARIVKEWDIEQSRKIREQTIMVAATIFELTQGKLPRIFYAAGDVVADINEEGIVNPIFIITMPFFLNDPDTQMAAIVGGENVLEGTCSLGKEYGLDGASLDEQYLLFFLRYLAISEYFYRQDEQGRLYREKYESKLFQEPEIVFSGVTKALIRMYGEKEGTKRALSIFTKFSEKRTEFQDQALAYLDRLKERCGIKKAEQESAKKALIEELRQIKPGSFQVVDLRRLMDRFNLDERTVARELEELGFKPVRDEPDKWKRIGWGTQTPPGDRKTALRVLKRHFSKGQGFTLKEYLEKLNRFYKYSPTKGSPYIVHESTARRDLYALEKEGVVFIDRRHKPYRFKYLNIADLGEEEFYKRLISELAVTGAVLDIGCSTNTKPLRGAVRNSYNNFILPLGLGIGALTPIILVVVSVAFLVIAGYLYWRYRKGKNMAVLLLGTLQKREAQLRGRKFELRHSWENEFSVYENRIKVGDFRVKYDKKSNPFKAILDLGDDRYTLDREDIGKLQLDRFLSRRRLLFRIGLLAAGGALFSKGLSAYLFNRRFIEPQRPLTKLERGLIEEFKRLALEIEDTQSRRYAVTFVKKFIRNGRLAFSKEDISDLSMGDTPMEYKILDDRIVINYPLYKSRGLHPALVQGCMVHEGKHIEDSEKQAGTYGKTSAMQKVTEHILRTIGSITEKGREGLFNPDGTWMKCPNGKFPLYQFHLLVLYHNVNNELPAHIAEYNFYRRIFGDLRSFTRGFREDNRIYDIEERLFAEAERAWGDLVLRERFEYGKRAGLFPSSISWDEYTEYYLKGRLKDLQENYFYNAVNPDGSINERQFRRNYFMRIMQNRKSPENKFFVDLVLLVEERRGTIQLTPDGGYRVINPDRFLDWLDTGIFVDENGDTVNLMELDLTVPETSPAQGQKPLHSFALFGIPAAVSGMLGFVFGQLWLEFGGWWRYKDRILEYIKIIYGSALGGIAQCLSRLEELGQWLLLIINQTYQSPFFIGQSEKSIPRKRNKVVANANPIFVTTLSIFPKTPLITAARINPWNKVNEVLLTASNLLLVQKILFILQNIISRIIIPVKAIFKIRIPRWVVYIPLILLMACRGFAGPAQAGLPQPQPKPPPAVAQAFDVDEFVERVTDRTKIPIISIIDYEYLRVAGMIPSDVSYSDFIKDSLSESQKECFKRLIRLLLKADYNRAVALLSNINHIFLVNSSQLVRGRTIGRDIMINIYDIPNSLNFVGDDINADSLELLLTLTHEAWHVLDYKDEDVSDMLDRFSKWIRGRGDSKFEERANCSTIYWIDLFSSMAKEGKIPEAAIKPLEYWFSIVRFNCNHIKDFEYGGLIADLVTRNERVPEEMYLTAVKISNYLENSLQVSGDRIEYLSLELVSGKKYKIRYRVDKGKIEEIEFSLKESETPSLDQIFEELDKDLKEFETRTNPGGRWMWLKDLLARYSLLAWLQVPIEQAFIGLGYVLFYSGFPILASFILPLFIGLHFIRVKEKVTPSLRDIFVISTLNLAFFILSWFAVGFGVGSPLALSIIALSVSTIAHFGYNKWVEDKEKAEVLQGVRDDASHILQRSFFNKIYRRLVRGVRGIYPKWKVIDKDTLWQIVTDGKLPSGWPGLVTAMRHDGVIDKDDFILVSAIGEILEDTDLRDEIKALLTEAISIDVLLEDGRFRSEFMVKLRKDLNHRGDVAKVVQRLYQISDNITFNEETGEVKFRNIEDYCFIIELERLLGYEVYSEVMDRYFERRIRGTLEAHSFVFSDRQLMVLDTKDQETAKRKFITLAAKYYKGGLPDRLKELVERKLRSKHSKGKRALTLYEEYRLFTEKVRFFQDIGSLMPGNVKLHPLGGLLQAELDSSV